LGIAVIALLVFEPWTLFTDKVVDEELPVGVTAEDLETPAITLPSNPAPSDSRTSSAPGASPSQSPPAVTTLATGAFISHEHATTGHVRVLQLAYGRRVLRIDGLDTSNGPDLHVWITDAPVRAGRAGWFVFDDGRHIDLGELKGNQGNQNYVLPPEVDLDELTSVSIWCQRFHVSFGAASLN
jgi:hypothetical protein